MLLDIVNASKSYRAGGAEVHALSEVGLAVDAGEFVAVQGPSGCGKSTLLLIAGGLLSPSSGRVTIAGEDAYAMSSEARSRFRAKTTGFVFQQFHLIPYLSVLDNVLAPSLAVGANQARDRAIELTNHFGMAHRIHHLPGELSSGERQRVALARALLNDPQLLLADEPTGNLDEENQSLVLDHLQEIAAKGTAVLLVTHDLAAAERADRIIRIRDGKLD